jgi:hypothetical protein
MWINYAKISFHGSLLPFNLPYIQSLVLCSPSPLECKVAKYPHQDNHCCCGCHDAHDLWKHAAAAAAAATAAVACVGAG